MRASSVWLVFSTGCLALFDGENATGNGSGTVDDGDDGPDPWLAEDDDGDGLDNGEEEELGTKTDEADSDGDGYTDFDEVQTEHDPLDEDDGIYVGGWPYNPNKDDIEGDVGNRASVGDLFMRLQMEDQHGDIVDLYDLAGQGKPIAIDLSGIWCSWCNELAKLLEGSKRSALYGYGWDDLGQQIQDDEFYWVTVLDADATGGSVDHDEIVGWYEKYPHEKVIVLGDYDMELVGYLKVVGYPTMILIDENMVITQYNKNDYTEALTILAERSWDDL